MTRPPWVGVAAVAGDESMRLEHPVDLPADLPAQRFFFASFAGRARGTPTVTWDQVLGSWDRRPRRRSAARDASRRRDIGRGKLGSALMSRVNSDTGAPPAG